jgi:hypothetical protein
MRSAQYNLEERKELIYMICAKNNIQGEYVKYREHCPAAKRQVPACT